MQMPRQSLIHRTIRIRSVTGLQEEIQRRCLIIPILVRIFSIKRSRVPLARVFLSIIKTVNVCGKYLITREPGRGGAEGWGIR